MHLKASSYFTDPESGTSRAWDKFRKQLQAEYHIQSEPSAAAARAFHFRLPGHPLWTMDSSKLTRAGALLQIPAEIATSVTASAAAAALRGERIPPMQVKEEQVKVHVTMHKVRITMRHEREFDPRWGAARAGGD